MSFYFQYRTSPLSFLRTIYIVFPQTVCLFTGHCYLVQLFDLALRVAKQGHISCDSDVLVGIQSS